MMLYVKKGKKLLSHPFVKHVPENTVWIDILNLTLENEKRLEEDLQLNIPSREEMHEIELSSRLYQEKKAIYMTITVVTKSTTPEPETHDITFIVTADTLLTLRYSDPMPFRNFIMQLDKLPSSQHTSTHLFTGLVNSIIERIADILEAIGHEVDSLTRQIFRAAHPDSTEKANYQATLEAIGRAGDLVSKTRESLVTLSRMASYALQSPIPGLKGDRRLIMLARDIPALSDHANFLSNKLNFLLDATLGMINIEQNNTIKIFSVAAVVFLPPTLIASIYGMNFVTMPELHWPFGYPLALSLMLLSSWVPYKYFKRRKWL